MDFKLTEDQLMIRQMVREFAQKEIKPLSIQLDAKSDPQDCIPWQLIKRASELGLRTMTIPKELGGLGADYLTQAIVLEELGAADLGFASIMRGNLTHASVLVKECNKEQHDEFLPDFLKDDTFVLATARTEPNAGTDAHLPNNEPGASTQTYAERKGDEYIINGSKHFISNGGIAKLYFVHVRTDKKLPITECTSVFLIPQKTPGFSIGKFHNKMGRRLLPNAELIFEDARVPARYLVGQEGKKWSGLAPKSPPFGLLGTACTLGTLRNIYETTLDYTKNRIQGGKPIFKHATVAIKLATMRVNIEAIRTMVWKCAWSWQTKTDYDPTMGLAIKGFTDKAALDIVNYTVNIFGGMGTDKSLPIEKYIRDIYTTLHGYGTTEMALWQSAANL